MTRVRGGVSARDVILLANPEISPHYPITRFLVDQNKINNKTCIAGVYGHSDVGSEACFLPIYYKKYFCSEKYTQSAFSRTGCPWRAGYGIIPMPLSIVPSPQQQKDVSHVAPPAHHHAGAGR